MTNRHLFIRGLRAAAACATLVLAPSALAQTADYTTIPPDPAELEQKLTATPVTLAQAIAAAEKASGGHAVEAKAMTAGDAINYEIFVEAMGMVKRAVVNGKTGAVEVPTLTTASALEKATAVVKGAARSVVFNMSAEPPTATVMIYLDHKAHKVVINAITGETISNDPMERFPGATTTNEVHTTDSGLMYIDMEEGTGPTPAGPTSRVKVHYTGYFVDGNKFDSSVDRGQPAEFSLRGVIPGWTEGVGSMRVGGKRKLIVPYALGYGERGRQGIPPKATLIFDVELIEADAAPPTPPPAPAGTPRAPGSSGAVPPAPPSGTTAPAQPAKPQG